MKLKFWLPPAAFIALLCLAPAAGRAPSLVAGAAAYTTVNNWDTGESEDTEAQRFLRGHGKQVFYGVGVVLFVVFSFMIGPVGRYRRGFGGYRGFGSGGGFGGTTSLKNPWE
ncbi:MAG: hypothetical protein NTY45_01770 [Elusimicrobia bacterium]|nr:hypothetical protein [Elusimicrobiota bacterium]